MKKMNKWTVEFENELLIEQKNQLIFELTEWTTKWMNESLIELVKKMLEWMNDSLN